MTRYFGGIGEWSGQAAPAREAAGPSDHYDVDVTRFDEGWEAILGGLPGGTFAPTLAELKQYVREVTILSADLSEDAEPQFTLQLMWPAPGQPTLQPDAEL